MSNPEPEDLERAWLEEASERGLRLLPVLTAIWAGLAMYFSYRLGVEFNAANSLVLMVAVAWTAVLLHRALGQFGPRERRRRALVGLLEKEVDAYMARRAELALEFKRLRAAERAARPPRIEWPKSFGTNEATFVITLIGVIAAIVLAVIG